MQLVQVNRFDNTNQLLDQMSMMNMCRDFTCNLSVLTNLVTLLEENSKRKKKKNKSKRAVLHKFTLLQYMPGVLFPFSIHQGKTTKVDGICLGKQARLYSWVPSNPYINISIPSPEIERNKRRRMLLVMNIVATSNNISYTLKKTDSSHSPPFAGLRCHI